MAFWSFLLLGSVSMSDCPPPPMGALFGPGQIGVFSASVCFRKVPPRRWPVPMIIA